MLHPLPFATFAELAARGFKATVYCSRCYEHRPIDLAAEHLRDRCFATTRFRCTTKIRYTGAVCGSSGSVEIEPSVLLPAGGKDILAFYATLLPKQLEIEDTSPESKLTDAELDHVYQSLLAARKAAGINEKDQLGPRTVN